jgi:hypothetical protein
VAERYRRTFDEALWEFLFLRLSAEEALALVEVSRANQRLILETHFRKLDLGVIVDHSSIVLATATWGPLEGLLLRVGAMGPRVAWVIAVVRAPQRTHRQAPLTLFSDTPLSRGSNPVG